MRSDNTHARAGCRTAAAAVACRSTGGLPSQEKKETKKQVKKLASAKDAEEMRKALAKIVVFPKIDKIEVPDLKHAAQEEHDLIGELFTSLDDSGALTTLRLCSAVCARAAEAAER